MYEAIKRILNGRHNSIRDQYGTESEGFYFEPGDHSPGVGDAMVKTTVAAR
jgi:hypothetical protein